MDIPQHLMSEANIQAEFFGACKGIGLNCALEVSTPVGRLDVGIFSEDWSRLLAVVECKKRRLDGNTAQIGRYKQIGVPVYGLRRMDSLSLARKIQGSGLAGIPFEQVLAMQGKPRRKRDGSGRTSGTLGFK